MEESRDETAPVLLVVDDQEFMLEMIGGFLESSGYSVHTAKNGEEAWNELMQWPGLFSAVLLDRIMPRAGEFKDGLDVLKKMKTYDSLKKIPVIIQTGMTEERDIIEGLQAGAYYYLAKPLKQKILLEVVNAAVRDYTKSRYLTDQAQEIVDAVICMKNAYFEFRTLEEGQRLATLMGSMCPGKEDVVVGLWELIANAVEHGNLGITYEEKSRLNKKDQWEEEVKRRMELPEYKSKYVQFEVQKEGHEVQFTIQDQGKGFDWKEYMDFSPDRAFDNHGRGIAMANNFHFERLEYYGRGNIVTAVVKCLLPL